VRTTFEHLADDARLPCILHWNQNHFVVCYKIKRRRKNDAYVYIADPASQKVVYRKEEFLRCWLSGHSGSEDTGIALLMEPGPGFGEQEDEQRSPRRDLLFFLRYLLPYRQQFLQLFVAMLVGSGLQLLLPFLAQAKVDIGIRDGNLNFIVLILVAQLCIFVSQLSLDFLRGWLTLHVNARIDIALISDFLQKLTRLPLRYFDTKMTGDIMQRISDHGRIKSFLMGQSVGLFFSFGNFIVFAAILAYFDWQILLISLFGNGLYVGWVMLFMRYRRILDTRRFNQSAGEQNKLIQLVQGMQEIKLNNCEKQKRWEWERIQVKLFKINIDGLRIGQIQQTGSAFFTQSTSIIITFLAAKAVIEGSMTLGMMMSLSYIIGQVSAPINSFIGFAQAYQDAKISLERLNEVHRRRDEELGIGSKLNRLPDKKNIVFSHVTFSYSGASRDYAVEDVSLTIPEHKVTAIVGASGSGKTTLVKLLLGFYKPLSGTIKIGNTPLEAINPHLWRSKTGAVMQDSFIFSDTIAKNIAVATETVDLERLREAARIANVQEFVYSLPLGYDTKIGMEGSGVSQGQRQRLLIARAVYKSPEFIFFDEATNSLDANNERIILDNLKHFYKGKTVLIVAHRLSTVKSADNIVVMEKGKVAEQGTHRQLTEKRGLYYSLVKNQLELGT
jgi:ATP-binding cassette subfamily B protein